MVQKTKNQNKLLKAFTLIELVIVLVIIGIMLMATIYLSWEQIQKVKNKTVKESILAEMQSRYSRNLWSSSFAWMMYETMDVTFSWWENKINFKYNVRNNEDSEIENIFTDKFEIKNIILNYTSDNSTRHVPVENITLKYSPYHIYCEIWDEETNTNVVIIARVNDNKDYCFEIEQKNCRMIEMSELNCDKITLINNA